MSAQTGRDRCRRAGSGRRGRRAEARLRNGPRAAALPASGTSEGRQLRRWLTQLIVTERVVAAEAAARGLTAREARRPRPSCCPT